MRNSSLRICVFLAGSMLLVACVDAQSPTATGVIVLADRATLGTVKLSNGTTIYSGDLLRTETGGGLQIQVDKIQLTLAQNSSARVFRIGNRLVVELERGTIAYLTSGNAENVELYALDIRFVPQTAYPSAGQVSVAGRCEVRAMATRSVIVVRSGDQSKTIEEKKAYRVTSEMGVDYREGWVPVPKDYPDFAKDSEYHHSHSHSGCPVAYKEARELPRPAGANHFSEVIVFGWPIPVVPVVLEVLESPDQP